MNGRKLCSDGRLRASVGASRRPEPRVRPSSALIEGLDAHDEGFPGNVREEHDVRRPEASEAVRRPPRVFISVAEDRT